MDPTFPPILPSTSDLGPRTSDAVGASRANWHTHTFRCKHATGDVADYARAAVAAGLTTLGMSDHAPLPGGAWPDYRMGPEELPDYVAAVRAAQAEFPTLTIRLGLECDWSPAWDDWYRHLREEYGFDYLIVGCHATPWQGGWIDSFGDLTDAARVEAYAEYCVAVMESGHFAALTHPDVLGVSVAAWTPAHTSAARRIARAAKATGTALELNGNGLRKPQPWGRPSYPWRPFWDTVAEEGGVRVIVSSDAHRPEDIVAGLATLEIWRAELGLALNHDLTR